MLRWVHPQDARGAELNGREVRGSYGKLFGDRSTVLNLKIQSGTGQTNEQLLFD